MTHASFDDPNLVSQAALVPVLALAERAGLTALVRELVSVDGHCGMNAGLKIGCLVAGMAAGADRIDDMDVLRHGAMAELSGGIRAPSTLGSFLRSFSWGNVRQLDAVARRLLPELAGRAPLLPGGEVLAFIDMDSMQKRSLDTLLDMHQLIRIQPGSTPAQAYTAPRRGENVRYRLTGLLQETINPWPGALAATTLPVRLIGVVLLTDERLLFSGKFWIPRKPSRFWAINDALEGGGTNYATRAAQFVERRDIHAVGHCPLDWINAVQLERPDTALVSEGNSPMIGFCTVQNQSLSCVSVRPLDDPASPWSVYVQQTQFIVRCIASARSREHPNDDTLRMLIANAHYDASEPECVGWKIPYFSHVPIE